MLCKYPAYDCSAHDGYIFRTQISRKYPSLEKYARYHGYIWPFADVVKAHLKYKSGRARPRQSHVRTVTF